MLLLLLSSLFFSRCDYIETGVTKLKNDLSISQSAHNASSFLPVVVNVRVSFPDDEPMADAVVIGINHEYCFRESGRTNSSGWVTLKAIPGNWSFFSYPGRSIQIGLGYFPCVLNQQLTLPIEEITLKPDREVTITLTSTLSGLTDFDGTDIWVTETNVGFFGEVGLAGTTKNNNFTLLTNGCLTARLSLNRKAQLSDPGVIFVSDPTPLEGSIKVNLTSINTAKLTLEFRDKDNNLASGAHVQFHVMERSWQWSPYIVDYSSGNLTFFTSLSNLWVFCGTDIFQDSVRYRMLFNSKHLIPTSGDEMLLRFGGPLSSKVLVTPRSADGFGAATQVMLYTTDAYNNTAMEVWRVPGDRIKPHLVINTTSGKQRETDMDLAFASKILEEFEPSENPQYRITYDFGPYGNKTFEGGLYDVEPLRMIIYETDRLIPQSPAIDDNLRLAQVNYYERLFQSMEELMGVPTDYKIGVISNIMHAGFEDEILHGFKLELPLEIGFPPTWPLGDGFIGHEMGHGRIHKPPANYGLWGESYATLLGYKARTHLFGDNRLFDFLMGSHDLFLRHQHGDPVQNSSDQIETMEFIIYYIHIHYGWNMHRSMILEWENAFVPLRNVLSISSYSEIEQMATIYSFLVGENLAWLYELGGFDVTKERVETGIGLILQDQAQPIVDELKVGETNAVTYTASVPIMLRRVPSGISRISLAVTFNDTFAKVLNVHRRDLTANEDWNLTAISEPSGHLAITLEGSMNITRPGSIAQIDFELFPSDNSELLIEVLSTSTNSGLDTLAQNGRITTNQLSVVRPQQLPFVAESDSRTHYLTMTSNSTIRDFHFDQRHRQISFNVSAPMGTVGFCNITIPIALLNFSSEEWVVLVDGELIVPLVTQNASHTVLCFNYVHSTHHVVIVPEFYPFSILPLFMLVTALTVTVYKRRKARSARAHL